MNTLRETYGDRIDVASDMELNEAEQLHAVEYAFPSLQQLEKATEAELRKLGFGYRANFIVESVKMIKKNGGEQWLRSLRDKDDETVRESLI